MARSYWERVFEAVTFSPSPPPEGPAGNTGTWREMFSYILYEIGQLKGADHNDAPATTLPDVKSHLDNTDGSEHGGHINQIQDHGTNLPRSVRKVNMAGSGNTLTISGDTATVSTSSGGAGGTDHTILSSFHTDTVASDTPANGDVLRRVAGAWESGPVDGTNFSGGLTDPVAGTAGLRTLGTGAQQAASGTDSRFHTRGHSLLSDADHTDMTTGLTPTDGQTLQYQASTSKWVLAPPPYVSTQLIDGLTLTWDSANQLGVETGACYIPNLGKVLELTTRASFSVSFAASSSAWHYIYAYDNGSGGLTFEYNTTAPVVYRGYARHKTGDTSRRYIGPILPNGATTPAMRKFFMYKNGQIRWLENPHVPSPFTLVDADQNAALGIATTETTVNAIPVVPITSRLAQMNVWTWTSATSPYWMIGNSEDAITLGYNNALHWGYGYRTSFNNELSVQLDSSQAYTYRWSTSPGNGNGLSQAVLGFWETR